MATDADIFAQIARSQGMSAGDAPPLLSPTDLNTFNQTVQASNPYGMIGRGLAEWQPRTETWSPATTGITMFGKSFLSGLLGNYARNQSAEQLNSVVNSLPSLEKDPYAAALPAGVDSNAYNVLRGTALLNKNRAEAMSAAQGSKNMADMLQTVLGEGVKAGTISPGQALKAAKTGDYSGLFGEGGVDALKNPNSPAYKIGQDKLVTEKSLSNDFNSRATTFKLREQGLNALAKAYLDTSGTSDYEMIRRGAQAVEPGLAVRADDQASLEGAASVLGLTTAAIENAISGKSKLSPEVRAGIMRIAQRANDASVDDYNLMRRSFLDRAKAANLVESSVIPYGEAKYFKDLYPDLQIGGGVGAAAIHNEADLIAAGYIKGANGYYKPGSSVVGGSPRG